MYRHQLILSLKWIQSKVERTRWHRRQRRSEIAIRNKHNGTTNRQRAWSNIFGTNRRLYARVSQWHASDRCDIWWYLKSIGLRLWCHYHRSRLCFCFSANTFVHCQANAFTLTSFKIRARVTIAMQDKKKTQFHIFKPPIFIQFFFRIIRTNEIRQKFDEKKRTNEFEMIKCTHMSISSV